MKLRRRVQAILVGGGTVRADDPQLTVRGALGLALSPCASFGQDPGGCPKPPGSSPTSIAIAHSFSRG